VQRSRRGDGRSLRHKNYSTGRPKQCRKRLRSIRGGVCAAAVIVVVSAAKGEPSIVKIDHTGRAGNWGGPVDSGPGKYRWARLRSTDSYVGCRRRHFDLAAGRPPTRSGCSPHAYDDSPSSSRRDGTRPNGGDEFRACVIVGVVLAAIAAATLRCSPFGRDWPLPPGAALPTTCSALSQARVRLFGCVDHAWRLAHAAEATRTEKATAPGFSGFPLPARRARRQDDARRR